MPDLLRALVGIVLVSTACAGSNELIDHADGDGPLRFAPGANVRTEFSAPSQAPVLIGGMPVYNEGDRAIEIEAIDVSPSGACRVVPELLREPLDRNLTGTSSESPEKVGAYPLDDDPVIPPGTVAALLFSVDGTGCAAGEASEYGPVTITYRHGEFPLRAEFGFYFEVQW